MEQYTSFKSVLNFLWWLYRFPYIWTAWNWLYSYRCWYWCIDWMSIRSM